MEHSIDLKEAAIHEAGHIVAAHIMGFPVEWVSICNSGNGQTKIDYGGFKNIALKLMNLNASNSVPDAILKTLDPDVLSELTQFAERLCFVLLAGDVAEFVFFKHPECKNDLIIEVKGKDITTAEAISNYLEMNINLQEMVEILFKYMQHSNYISSITELSNNLIDSSNYTINRNSIENILCKYNLHDC